MTDVVDKSTRSRMMRGITGRNTRPELAVRSYLHRCGIRFRIHGGKLPGRPDVVLKKHKTVVMVHGCFWHGHRGCKYFKWPKSRAAFWKDKIQKNIARDRAKSKALYKAGWKEVVVWECDIREGNFGALAALIRKAKRRGD